MAFFGLFGKSKESLLRDLALLKAQRSHIEETINQIKTELGVDAYLVDLDQSTLERHIGTLRAEENKILHAESLPPLERKREFKKLPDIHRSLTNHHRAITAAQLKDKLRGIQKQIDALQIKIGSAVTR